MEVEIKSKVEDLSKVEKKLLGLGAHFLKEMKEEDEYFNHPCRDFAQTDEALRIRNDGTLTYKGPKVDKDTKSREEINVEIGDRNSMRKLLISLGFLPVEKVNKKRKYYRLGEIIVTLDEVEDLGSFIEVECIGEYESCRKKVLQLADLLGLKEFIRESYLEMLLEKSLKEGQHR